MSGLFQKTTATIATMPNNAKYGANIASFFAGSTTPPTAGQSTVKVADADEPDPSVAVKRTPPVAPGGTVKPQPISVHPMGRGSGQPDPQVDTVNVTHGPTTVSVTKVPGAPHLGFTETLMAYAFCIEDNAKMTARTVTARSLKDRMT